MNDCAARPSSTIVCIIRSERTSVSLELQHVRCVSRELGATRIGDHQLGAVLDRV